MINKRDYFLKKINNYFKESCSNFKAYSTEDYCKLKNLYYKNYVEKSLGNIIILDSNQNVKSHLLLSNKFFSKKLMLEKDLLDNFFDSNLSKNKFIITYEKFIPLNSLDIFNNYNIMGKNFYSLPKKSLKEEFLTIFEFYNKLLPSSVF